MQFHIIFGTLSAKFADPYPKPMHRQYSFTDQIIFNIDLGIRTLFIENDREIQRPTPAQDLKESNLSNLEKKHIAGLMRVNHSGEVCAQALYQGQALTAKLDEVKNKMAEAAIEEIDHLGWCETRLQDLNAKPSHLNIIWYFMSLTIGATAGLIGDKWSLGFVVETEKQVTKHLEEHIKQLPKKDLKSLAILEQMVIDETMHATIAFESGGAELPFLIKNCMQLMSKAMTNSSYYL